MLTRLIFRYFAAGLPLLLLAAGHAAAQAWAVSRTEYGDPDLQGLWNNTTLTPFERPRELGEQLIYSEEEAIRVEQEATAVRSARPTEADPGRSAPAAGTFIGQQAEEEFTDFGLTLTRIHGQPRTSLIVDTADGRFPFLDGGRNRDIFGRWREAGFGPFDGPEIRSAGERCLSAIGTMPPMALLPYNSNIQIVQNRDYVMIVGEMVHDARIIRLDGTHQPSSLKYWFGDSIGHWEGDTLVVHSINFHPQISNFRLISSEQLEVTERFTRISETEIFYSYVVEDPEIFAQPFTVEMILTRLPPGQQMYEFACHEGNYAMRSILAGARREEVEKARAD
ncbi:MAG: hypothetical protein R3F41_09565 [Gammaproteobacteria bacterium]|nr:hypothetical protein [Pseudomonadales bacterium]